ncbi:MAG: bifunctional folylpolyglutamate synthase/dihydrofolate synthase [Oscillospiraceae bacterium]|nr:bifunctional folylpolyglutamate synthase/dihydrofolate synthase [Oscillospiraceae bacterium]
MNVQQCIEYIHSKFRKGSIPGLHRIGELLDMLGNPQKELKFIHIAGTNGKGSTAAMSASILNAAGYRTGLFTSPYIYRFHERIQFCGEQIADGDLVEVVNHIYPYAERMADPPTEFELVCAVAFEYYRRKKADIIVLECGMGGLMDATNIIPSPEVAVITNIGLDHTDMLGDTLELIAGAKAGIFKEGSHAVIYRGTAGVEQVFEDACAEKQIPLRKADFDTLVCRERSLFGQVFDCGDRKGIELPLLGEHQMFNASVVLSVMDALTERGWAISEAHIREGMKTVTWPGRFDIVCRDPLFIIDGGHNPQCIEALVKNIRDYLAGRRVIALVGVLADKDYADMFRPVMELVEQFVCITPDSPRKLEADDLARYLRGVGAEAEGCGEMENGIRRCLELAGSDGVVLCFGSLYSIGAVKAALDAVLAE